MMEKGQMDTVITYLSSPHSLAYKSASKEENSLSEETYYQVLGLHQLITGTIDLPQMLGLHIITSRVHACG